MQLDFDGQRFRTKVKLNDLDPTWNEKVSLGFSSSNLVDFLVVKPLTSTVDYGLAVRVYDAGFGTARRDGAQRSK